MKYLIIGAGGTGGILGAYMTKAGKNVTLIARNAHLAAMKEHGLTVRHLWDETVETIPVQAENMESYEKKIETAGEEEKPDVILVCVKGYSLDSTVPFIRKIAKQSTIVIPILNIYGTGRRLQEKTAGNSCDGWMYLCVRQHRRPGCPCAAWKDPAGRIRHPGKGRVPGRT
ncbi:MAG: ketopantoate reductase family protein [Clostridiaceae bacterium]